MAPILKLPRTNINKPIANDRYHSGNKPWFVLKQLLESSLNAGATNIRITIEHGGYKLLEVLDNSQGIPRYSAPLLCHQNLAIILDDDDVSFSNVLAIIARVGFVEVETFNSCDDCGWFANYECGIIVHGPVMKPVQNHGTRIRIKNLFKNLNQGDKGMQSNWIESKEAIIDLVQSYAFHYRAKLTLSLKDIKYKDLLCVLAPMSAKSFIGWFFGLEMEHNFIEMTYNNFGAKTYIALTHKKTLKNLYHLNFTLFVNNSLVLHNDLSRKIESLMDTYMSLNRHSILAYVSILVPQVCKQKSTTYSLITADMITFVCLIMKQRFEEIFSPQESHFESTRRLLSRPIDLSKKNLFPDSKARDNQTVQAACSSGYTSVGYNDIQGMASFEPNTITSNLKLKVIHVLKTEVLRAKNEEATKIIRNSNFISLVDGNNAIISHDTKLYAINLKALLKEQYYQFYLFDFAKFPPIEIPPTKKGMLPMIETYLYHLRESKSNDCKVLETQDSDSIITELVKRSKMFHNCIGLKITSSDIVTIPALMPNVIPELKNLAKFLVSLATRVDYSNATVCFYSIGKILADFYSEPPSGLENNQNEHDRYQKLVETKLYVAIKNYLIVPKWLLKDGNIREIAK